MVARRARGRARRRCAGAAASGRSASAGSPRAAVDLERLTDQVVRQIDRRIVAHRERLGRI